VDIVELGLLPEAWLRLTCDETYPLELASVQLQVGGASASTDIEDPYKTGFAELTNFFAGLANDWRGWQGIRSWQSVEGHFRIDAQHDGHAQLDISMLESHPGRWSFKARLTFDAGEQVRQAAEDLQQFGRP
jgi:hypothetical protein